MIKANNDSDFLPERVQPGIGDPGMLAPAPNMNWDQMSESEHFVQFYEKDAFLLNSLGGFISAGLNAGDACIVVAKSARRKTLENNLQAQGHDVTAALACGRYIFLDAAGTLSKFMTDGSPSPSRFNEVIRGLIKQAATGRQRVRIFGEMVALLWAKRNRDGAIQLEKLWNDLQKTEPFLLFCAYPMSNLVGEAHGVPLARVCAGHSRVIPAETYTALSAPDDRLRAIIALQQKANSLQAEIVERKKIEAALHEVKEELEIQVADLRRLHELSLGLTITLDIESMLKEVLRAAMSVQGTNMGSLSLYESKHEGLKLKVSSGSDEEFLKQAEWISPGGGACGTCYKQGRRVVIEDVEFDPVFAEYKESARQAGFRACHSTPLITHGGTIIGVLSVHFRRPHRPSEREIRLIDIYTQMAADLIENVRLHQQAQRGS